MNAPRFKRPAFRLADLPTAASASNSVCDPLSATLSRKNRRGPFASHASGMQAGSGGIGRESKPAQRGNLPVRAKNGSSIFRVRLARKSECGEKTAFRQTPARCAVYVADAAPGNFIEWPSAGRVLADLRCAAAIAPRVLVFGKAVRL